MYGRLFFLIRFALPLRLVIGFGAVICLLAMLATNTRSWAAEPADSEAVQIVGLVQAPPFAMKDSEGNWEGIAVDLWRHVAHDLGLRFELQEMAIPDLVAGLQQGKLIAVVTAIASADRELLMEFSHPYYSSGLAIAVPVKASRAVGLRRWVGFPSGERGTEFPTSPQGITGRQRFCLWVYDKPVVLVTNTRRPQKLRGFAGGCASFPGRPLISLSGPLFSPGLEHRPPHDGVGCFGLPNVACGVGRDWHAPTEPAGTVSWDDVKRELSL
jgi:Bacterial extracellular solute-binding proteins, family 3